jgi:hypothetical protein
MHSQGIGFHEALVQGERQGDSITSTLCSLQFLAADRQVKGELTPDPSSAHPSAACSWRWANKL